MDTQRKSGSSKDSTMITLFVFLGLLNSAFAAEYTVGGNAGWTFLSSGDASYDSQFSNINLVVGDTLKFPYQANEHNVYVVNPSQLSSCDASNPLQVHNEADAVIALNTTGTWAFLCEIPNHCTQGAMHLQVTVGGGSAPTTAPVAAPVPAPVRAPVAAPVSSPVRAPVGAPIQPPSVPAPLQAPGPFGEGPEPFSGASASSMTFAAVLSSAAAGLAMLLL